MNELLPISDGSTLVQVQPGWQTFLAFRASIKPAGVQQNPKRSVRERNLEKLYFRHEQTTFYVTIYGTALKNTKFQSIYNWPKTVVIIST